MNVEVPPATPLARVHFAGSSGGSLLALSPDGARLVVSLRGADGKTRLHTRMLHQSQIAPLAGTKNAHGPFFSPDGAFIGFFADGKMKKMAVEGGAAVTLCDAPLGYGGSWGDDGNIIAALERTTGLSRIPSAGGTPAPVTKLNAGERAGREDCPRIGDRARGSRPPASATDGRGSYDRIWSGYVLNFHLTSREQAENSHYWARPADCTSKA